MNNDNAFLRARRCLLLDHVFFGSLIMHLDPVADETAKHGVWANGVSIGYNPESLEGMELAEGAGLLAKSVLQCGLGHHLRRQHRDNKIWQRASDLVVNPEIIASGLQLPPGCDLDKQYAGKSVEQVYTILELEAQEESNCNAPGDNDSGGDSSNQAGEGPAQGGGENQPQTGEVRDLPGDAEQQVAGASDISNQEREWKIAMQQAMQNAKARGTLPGTLKQLIEKELTPKVSWASELRRFMQAISRNDLSWNKPNRRFIGSGLYLPAARSETMGTMVIVNDTSGSTLHDQKKFFSEMEAIIEETKPEKVIYVMQDSAIASIQEIEIGDPIPYEIKGMGGTDFRPVFAWLDKEGIEPACMVFLTDLDGPFPDVEPAYPVLWAACGSTSKVPFGDVVSID